MKKCRKKYFKKLIKDILNSSKKIDRKSAKFIKGIKNKIKQTH